MALRWLALAVAALSRIDAAGHNCASRSKSQCGGDGGDCLWHSGQCRQICFRRDFAYTGGVAGMTRRKGSQEQCRLHCQNVLGCVHFTYYAATGACHLHNDSASRLARPGAVSGEPDCIPVVIITSAGAAPSGQEAHADGSMPGDVGLARQQQAGHASGGLGNLNEAFPSIFPRSSFFGREFTVAAIGSLAIAFAAVIAVTRWAGRASAGPVE